MSDHVDPSGLRRQYDGPPFDLEGLAPTWLEQFQRWLDDAVAATVPEPNAMVVATADAGGAPSARTVLLRGVDERGFVFYTNLESRKGREALANPRAALTLPWLALQRQILVTGAVSVVSEEESDAYWATRPAASRRSAAASNQSEPVGSREELERAVAAQPDEPPRPERWGGFRLEPDTYEFWRHRDDRLHERHLFRRSGDGWQVVLLQP